MSRQETNGRCVMPNNKGPERFTVLLIPHSAQPMSGIRLSSRLIQVCCVLLVVVFLSLTVVAAQYAQMTARLHELRDLRLLAQMQDEQLRALTLSTSHLQNRLRELAHLEDELRRMLRLENATQTDQVEALLAASRQVTIAAGGGVGIGDSQVDSLAATTATLSAAGVLAGTLEVLQQEMEGRFASLEDVQMAAADQLAYEASRPSVWPTQGHVSSRFGYRASPFGVYREFHPGIDIAAPLGTPVVATGDGRVIFTGWRTDLGNTIIIDHGYDLRTVYGHVAKVAVDVGDLVKKSQVIAYVGSTGRSTGPHVHYEVHLRGTQVNPAPYLQ